MRVLLWIVEGTWTGCVDAARRVLPADAEVTLLHVVPGEVAEVAAGAAAGLLGRGRRREPTARIRADADRGAQELLAAAGERLGRPAATLALRGRVEHLVVEAAEAERTELLVAARDGDRARLGPHSLGPWTRFVVDHAPCAVLLVWPEAAPGIDSMPMPPPPPPAALSVRRPGWPPRRPAPPPGPSRAAGSCPARGSRPGRR
jgi:nucleotide-binding universal stress UspA family protein